ncbi:hypothetical protein Tco_0809598, partial [Tanacetum coccineum]
KVLLKYRLLLLKYRIVMPWRLTNLILLLEFIHSTLKKGDNNVEAKGFDFLAPTTRRNSMRFYWEEVQALEIRLVLALGMFSGHSGLRIKTFWFTDKLIKTGYSGSFRRRNSWPETNFEVIDAHIGHIT